MSFRLRKVQIPPLEALAKKATAKAGRAVFAEMFGRYQQAMGAKAWDWPQATRRSNGSIAGSPRTIVDTGILRASGYLQVAPEGTTATFGWAAGYASAIHEGARLRNGGFIPPRPWTDVVNGDIQGTGKVKPYPKGERTKALWLKFFLQG